MKKFVDPEYSAVLLNTQDVIVTSGCTQVTMEEEDCIGAES